MNDRLHTYDTMLALEQWCGPKTVKVQHPQKIIKYAQNIRRTFSTCEQSQPTKFEYEGMKTDGSYRLLKPDTFGQKWPRHRVMFYIGLYRET